MMLKGEVDKKGQEAHVIKSVQKEGPSTASFQLCVYSAFAFTLRRRRNRNRKKKRKEREEKKKKKQPWV